MSNEDGSASDRSPRFPGCRLVLTVVEVSPGHPDAVCSAHNSSSLTRASHVSAPFYEYRPNLCASGGRCGPEVSAEPAHPQNLTPNNSNETGTSCDRWFDPDAPVRVGHAPPQMQTSHNTTWGTRQYLRQEIQLRDAGLRRIQTIYERVAISAQCGDGAKQSAADDGSERVEFNPRGETDERDRQAEAAFDGTA